MGETYPWARHDLVEALGRMGTRTREDVLRAASDNPTRALRVPAPLEPISFDTSPPMPHRDLEGLGAEWCAAAAARALERKVSRLREVVLGLAHGAACPACAGRFRVAPAQSKPPRREAVLCTMCLRSPYQAAEAAWRQKTEGHQVDAAELVEVTTTFDELTALLPGSKS